MKKARAPRTPSAQRGMAPKKERRFKMERIKGADTAVRRIGKFDRDRRDDSPLAGDSDSSSADLGKVIWRGLPVPRPPAAAEQIKGLSDDDWPVRL